MSKKPQISSASRSKSLIALLFLCSFIPVLAGCDRGASEQVQAAEKFADYIVRNNVPGRDSMIATNLFKAHFKNDYVNSDFMEWMNTIYDMKTHKFAVSARADVDRDLKPYFKGGALIDPAEVEETGMVRAKSSVADAPAAYFWMVKQKGKHWAVAMVTKGELEVDFNAHP